jgi:hypothetical protein
VKQSLRFVTTGAEYEEEKVSSETREINTINSTSNRYIATVIPIYPTTTSPP